MKERLDILILNLGYAESRERAKALIMEGRIYVNGQREDKPGSMFDPYAPIEVRGTALPYVSRGGLKLEKALRVFPVSLAGKICLDAGASTGGFTDCMLQNGASKVYAVDVGYGQLHYKLRTDPRVVNLEKTNMRYVTAAEVPELVGFASADVSFISLTKILEPLKRLLAPGGEAVVLVKPQFEAGREKVGKKGVVRDPAVHEEVCRQVMAYAESLGLAVGGLTYSPVKGPEGNIEYLLYLRKPDACEVPEHNAVDVRSLVEESHSVL